MTRDDDIKFMKRCLDLALGAEGMTWPNPMVGAVIVHEGLIAGEGFHLKAGMPHAEVNAFNSLTGSVDLSRSVLYVNLEPCSHFGSTPPCANLIISRGIKRIVIGTPDTSDKVAGRGIEKLKNAGCDVVTGVLEDECRWINRRFFTFNEKRRPWIILKWAQSADGYLDYERNENRTGKPSWITGEAERALVHKWRSREQAILAGGGTIRSDNPRLNVRAWTGKDPVRLILTRSGRIDKDSEVFKINGTNIVFTHSAGAKFEGSEVVILDRNKESAPQILDYLFVRGIQSLIVEGGAKILGHFISQGLWDEARIFTGMEYFRNGTMAPVAGGDIVYTGKFSRSTLKILVNSSSGYAHSVDNYNKYL